MVKNAVNEILKEDHYENISSEVDTNYINEDENIG